MGTGALRTFVTSANYLENATLDKTSSELNGIYCDSYIEKPRIMIYNGEVDYGIGINKNQVYFANKDIKAVKEMQESLTGMTIYYPLATPTYDQITDETLIAQLEALHKFRTEHGVNHIWTEAEELEPNLEFTYKRSNNLRLQALEQAVVALGGV